MAAAAAFNIHGIKFNSSKESLRIWCVVKSPAVRKIGADMNRTDRTQTHFLTAFLLLWLAGTALRLTILAVPPVIPLIHDELNLSATADRYPHWIAVDAVRPRGRAGFAADRPARRQCRTGGRPRADRDRRRFARRASRCDVALRHDDRDGSRRRHHAGDACRRPFAPGSRIASDSPPPFTRMACWSARSCRSC